MASCFTDDAEAAAATFSFLLISFDVLSYPLNQQPQLGKGTANNLC